MKLKDDLNLIKSNQKNWHCLIILAEGDCLKILFDSYN